MDIEQSKNQPGQNPQPQYSNVNQKKQSSKKQTPNKDLMRLERPIYQLKRPQESEEEFMIRKLMQKKQKPNIGKIQASPLLSKLKEMMPILEKSNSELLKKEVKESDKIDLRLEEVSDSSSQPSSDSQDSHQNSSCNYLGNGVEPKVQIISQSYNAEDMEAEETDPTDNWSQMQQQQSPKVPKKPQRKNKNPKKQCNHSEGHQNELELNFLTYPYLTEQQAFELTKKQQTSEGQQKKSETQEKPSDEEFKSKALVQEL